MSQGITVFRSLKAALDAGFHVFEPNMDGYLVRQRMVKGNTMYWQMAQVIV